MTFYISRLALETIVTVKRQIEPLPQTESAADKGEKECLILQSAFGIDFLKGATVRRQGAAISPSNIAKPLIASQRSSASRLFVLGKLTTQTQRNQAHSGFKKFPHSGKEDKHLWSHSERGNAKEFCWHAIHKLPREAGWEKPSAFWRSVPKKCHIGEKESEGKGCLRIIWKGFPLRLARLDITG